MSHFGFQNVPAAMGYALIVIAGASLMGCSQAPAGDAPAEPAEEQAHTHANEGETCFICDPSKRDPDRLWCNNHGRYEDRCFLCHPELRDEDRMYCKEHYLYEDECFLCHPELKEDSGEAPVEEAKAVIEEAGAPTPAERSDNPDRLFCKGHQVYEDECGICHPELLAGLTVGEGLKVRLPSPASLEKAGVRTGRPSAGMNAAAVEALGELSYNENNRAMVSPFAGGVVRTVAADVGQRVEAGAVLAEVNAPAVADAKSAYVKALVEAERHKLAFQREKDLVEQEISSREDFEAARAAYDQSTSEVERARQQLLNLGFSAEEVDNVKANRSTSSILPLRAPFAGVIVERNAVLGTKVEAGAPLFEVADLSTMWLELSVPEAEAMRLETGAPVEAQFDALPGETFEGTLTWIAPSIDETTRTAEARATLQNPGLQLKRGLFGRASIPVEAEQSRLHLPADAVQNIDGESVVFVKLAKDLYESRLVRTGPSMEGQRIVLAGLNASDEVAVAQSYVLKSELLKARLGAGCVNE